MFGPGRVLPPAPPLPSPPPPPTQRSWGILTPRRLLAAELSWTGELKPPDNKPLGCGVMKNLGTAADMADSSRRKTARLEKTARATDSPAER